LQYFFPAWPSHLARLALTISKWLCSVFHGYFFTLHVFIFIVKFFWARNKDSCCCCCIENGQPCGLWFTICRWQRLFLFKTKSFLPTNNDWTNKEVKSLITCTQKALSSAHETINCITVTHQDRRTSRFVSESIECYVIKNTREFNNRYVIFLTNKVTFFLFGV